MIALDASSFREQYGSKAALARALSSVYGALALAAYAMFLAEGPCFHCRKQLQTGKAPVSRCERPYGISGTRAASVLLRPMKRDVEPV